MILATYVVAKMAAKTKIANMITGNEISEVVRISSFTRSNKTPRSPDRRVIHPIG